MVLAPCDGHGLPDGGMVCFREVQPVPVRHPLDLENVTRLGITAVNLLHYRFASYMQQQADDNEKGEALLEADSPIVAAYKKRIEKQCERESQQTS